MRCGTCQACGASIVWILTVAGKSMPCDANPVYYAERPGGSKKIVTKDGRVLSCEYTAKDEADGVGFAPHWGSCPAAGKFKRKRDGGK